jgi:hypothetical protein
MQIHHKDLALKIKNTLEARGTLQDIKVLIYFLHQNQLFSEILTSFPLDTQPKSGSQPKSCDFLELNIVADW